MCTVTIVPLPAGPAGTSGGFRFACNRDELRTRTPALPPRAVRARGREAVHPVDADAGGTWVAVNDAGLALSLLNLNPPPSAPSPPHGGASRGAIIPGLLHHDRVAAALAPALAVDPAAQRPFRLVLADRTERALVRSDGRSVELVLREPQGEPFMVTSSGLGDHLVEAPRRALFTRTFAGPAGPPTDLVAAQDRFHRAHWPDRGHVSVSMARPDAFTHSHTVVRVAEDGVELVYRDGPPHLAPPAADDDGRHAALPQRHRLAARARTAG
jgi:hypothetical protein